MTERLIVPIADVLSFVRSDRYLSKKEAADYLKISLNQLRKDLEMIPHYKMTHRSLVFKRSELDRWIEAKRNVRKYYPHPPDVDERNFDEIIDKALSEVFGPERAEQHRKRRQKFKASVAARKKREEETIDLLFVYGTLKQGFPLHNHLKKFKPKLVGNAIIQADLYDLGAYPGAFLSKTPTARVSGELYSFSGGSDSLHELDQLEGYNPERPQEGEFVRRLTTASLPAGEERRAWVYLLCRRPGSKPIIKSGFYSRRD